MSAPRIRKSTIAVALSALLFSFTFGIDFGQSPTAHLIQGQISAVEEIGFTNDAGLRTLSVAAGAEAKIYAPDRMFRNFFGNPKATDFNEYQMQKIREDSRATPVNYEPKSFYPKSESLLHNLGYLSTPASEKDNLLKADEILISDLLAEVFLGYGFEGSDSLTRVNAKDQLLGQTVRLDDKSYQIRGIFETSYAASLYSGKDINWCMEGEGEADFELFLEKHPSAMTYQVANDGSPFSNFLFRPSGDFLSDAIFLESLLFTPKEMLPASTVAYFLTQGWALLVLYLASLAALVAFILLWRKERDMSILREQRGLGYHSFLLPLLSLMGGGVLLGEALYLIFNFGGGCFYFGHFVLSLCVLPFVSALLALFLWLSFRRAYKRIQQKR